MKTIATTAALVCAALALSACKPDGMMQLGGPKAKAGEVPTGYQVRGCTHYTMTGGIIRQVCRPGDPAKPFYWEELTRNTSGG